MIDKDTLMNLIDEYAEVRHINGCWVYNSKTASARQAVIEALSGVQALSAAPGEQLTREQIREVFMAHGFTIKEGQTDLKQYVYDAAYALLELVAAPPAEQQATKETSGGFHVWRDISTAPKDGSRFVATGHNYGLYSEVRHTCVAQWFRGCWMEASDWNETSELKYLTHWMPLPSPPDDVAAPAEQQAEESCVKLLAECRDAFPIPEPSSPLEVQWSAAMARPEEVPEYVRLCVAAMQAAPKAAPGDVLDEALRERDDAEDFIDALLDEVLGHERPEWSSSYGRADALNDVQERMTALHKPAVDKAWGRFQSAMAAPQQEPVAYIHVPHHTVEGKVHPVVSFEKYQQDYADGIYSTRIPLYTAPQPAPAPLSDDTERLEWLLWKLPGDALRYVVGELADTSSGAEFRAAIDAARARLGEKT